MKINIYLPGLPVHPGGGFKIMYEYANQFARHGHDVFVYNILKNPYCPHWMPHFLRVIAYNICFPAYRPRWFPLEKAVKCKNINQLRDGSVRDADVSFSTNWGITFALNQLPKSKGIKINLIQDYELWTTRDKEPLHASYRLPLIHIVIADYLADILEKENGKRPVIIYNAIDTKTFYVKIPVESRNPHSVSMLFSVEERKGTKYGLEALRICKKEIPDLSVELFGVYEKPDDLEGWIHYTKQPKDLCLLYNSTAIYFTPSNAEGWALPPAEAMNCGCAVICTDIGGHSAYAKNNETALLTEPANPWDMADKLLLLLRNNDERIRLAYTGNKFIQNFTWDRAFQQIDSLIKNAAGS
ncbi:MAG: glycosyltransferase family 4 [Treponematales bacterium]